MGEGDWVNGWGEGESVNGWMWMGDREASAMEMAEDELVEMGEGKSGEKF